jgi:hypothetical protein
VQSITALSSHQPTGSRPRMQSTELPHLKCDCRRSQPRLNKKAGCKNWFLSITPLGSYFQVNLAKGCTMFPRCTHRPPPHVTSPLPHSKKKESHCRLLYNRGEDHSPYGQRRAEGTTSAHTHCEAHAYFILLEEAQLMFCIHVSLSSPVPQQQE